MSKRITVPRTPIEVLQYYWGYENFREGQDKVIDSILEGNDTMFLDRTGGGKSITFQVPAILLPGTTIVISPLKALMENQVKNLQKKGISATYLNSDLSPEESKLRFSSLMSGDYKLLYISPEKFSGESFLEKLAQLEIPMVVVDELDTIEEYGNSGFRTEFLNIGKNIQILEAKIGKPIIKSAFTATANKEVQLEVVKVIGMKNNVQVFIGEVLADNIHIESWKYESGAQRDEEFLRIMREIRNKISKTGERCVVFCTSRSDVEMIEKWLNSYKVFKGNVVGVHAEHKKKELNLRKFDKGQAQIIVGTSVISRGIDYPDVRYVINYGIPSSIPEFVQEIGRGGRDGEKAYGLLMVGGRDEQSRKFLIGGDSKKMNEFAKLQDLLSTTECKTKYINNYFGKKVEGKCGHCSSCSGFKVL